MLNKSVLLGKDGNTENFPHTQSVRRTRNLRKKKKTVLRQQNKGRCKLGFSNAKASEERGLLGPRPGRNSQGL
jgi:hypothetical protein